MCPVSLMAEHCALGLLGKWEEAYMRTHTSLAQAQTLSLEFATFCAPQYFDIYFPASPSAIHNQAWPSTFRLNTDPHFS